MLSMVLLCWPLVGWQLGEHGEWAKITNFDFAAHAPMMIHDPSLTEMVVSDQYTEHVVSE